MKYPLIHSISTVGIRKHLHQDYLLHPLRTDFTGRNGVGKSVLADLFQLIFIADRKLIEFGTKGINDRTIEKVPLREFNEGYAFINVQIDTDNFITIGVCIPTHSSTEIQLFTITNSSNIKQPIKHLKFSKDRLPFSKHFLTETGNVQSIKKLQIQLRNNYNLYLHRFSTKNQKQEYYYWLYDKEILSIDLSLEDNLKAFARVIQSFSKSDALDIDNPNSLKDFLFEDTVKENKIKFDKEKDKLHNELIKYNNLNIEIDEYRNKQAYLEELNKKLEKKEEVLIDYYCILNREHENTTQELNCFENKLNKLLPKISKLEELTTRAEKEYKDASSTINILIEYNDKYKSLSNKRSKKNELVRQREDSKNKIESNKAAIEICSEKSKKLNVDQKNINEYFNSFNPIKEKSDTDVKIINECSGVYEKYASFQKLNLKYQEQQNKLRKLLSSTEERRKALDEVFEIVQNKKENSFFKFVTEKAATLSPAQEIVLFHFIGLLISEPDNPHSKAMYTNTPNDVLSEKNIKKTKDGIWFNYGNILEYIPYKTDRRFFDTESNVRKVFENQLTEIDSKISQTKRILKELGQIEQGQSYDKSIIKEYDFDEKLFGWTYSQINNFKLYEQLITKKSKEEYLTENSRLKKEYDEKKKKEGELNFTEKDLKERIKNHTTTISENKIEVGKLNEQISSLDKEIDVLTGSLVALSEKIEFSVQVTKLNDYIEKFEKLKQAKEARKDKLLKVMPKYIEEKTKLSEQIQNFKEDIENLKKEKEPLDKDVSRLEICDVSSSISENGKKVKLPLADLRISYTEKKQSYIEWYSSKSEHQNFPETSNFDNPQYLTQINDRSFIFNAMEQILLGSKIRFTDKIADHLHVANQNRKEISITLYERILSIFSLTSGQYKKFEQTVRGLNNFFADKKISEEFTFSINFIAKGKFNIDWINGIPKDYLFNHNNELQFGNNKMIENFIVNFFNDVNKVKIHNIAELLNPKNFFELKVDLTDENGEEISGSTGETYSSIILLGIGRLSEKQILVDEEDRPGLRFVILEETSNLDKYNFNIFTDIAYDFDYQLITMTPEPYGTDRESGWYMHHLIKGVENRDINEPNPASYFKTRGSREKLENYLERIKK